MTQETMDPSPAARLAARPALGVRPVRMGHLGLIVRDLDRMVSWYETVLGLRISDRMPYGEDTPYHEGVWMRCGTDHHVFSIFGLRDPAAGGSGGPLHHIAFEMPSFEDLRRAARLAREQGRRIHGMRNGGPGCQLRLYLLDPEDNVIELYWGLDQVGWDGAARPYPPIEDVDLEEIDVDAWLAWKGSEFGSRADPTGA
jgi:catechol-2,3-dioxygenase